MNLHSRRGGALAVAVAPAGAVALGVEPRAAVRDINRILGHDADAAVAFAHCVRVGAALGGNDARAAAKQGEHCGGDEPAHCSTRAKVRPRSSSLAPARLSSATSAVISASTSP